MATWILAAIVADTGSFQYSNAGPETFHVAGKMVGFGARPEVVAKSLFGDLPEANLKLLAKVLSTLEVDSRRKVATTLVSLEMFRETGAGPDAVEGFVEYPRSLEGVEVSALFREMKSGAYKVSMRSKGAEPEGLLVVDKPSGPTSHDVVMVVKKAVGVRKAGHLGTLDPMATGVLLVCVGPATKIAPFVADHDKEYEGVMALGAETDTWDSEGEITDRFDPSGVTESSVREVFRKMTGEVELEVPPFSAVKQGGERLYRKARRGETVKPPKRISRVLELELLSFESARAEFRCVVSRGTYVRSIVREAGCRLGVGGRLDSLRRTRSGGHSIEDAIPFNLFESGTDRGAILRKLIPSRYVLTNMPELLLDNDGAARVQNGGAITSDDVKADAIRLIGNDSTELSKAIDPDGKLVAVMERSKKGEGAVVYRPVRVWRRDGAQI